MTAAEATLAIDHVDALDCTCCAEPWPFAVTQADAIDRHWEAALRRRPRMFDGRVLMQVRGGIERRPDGRAVFRAAYTEVAFRAFLAWRDLGHPMKGFRNGFGMAALRAADGAFILAEMAAHTANGGQVYFPAGTPDRADIVGTRVDIPGSIRRELTEETGLDPADLSFGDGFTVIQDAVRVCFMQETRAPEPADALVARITAWIGREPLPELARLHVVRSVADITPAMPPFLTAYLRLVLGG